MTFRSRRGDVASSTTKDGAEIDFIVERAGRYTPIEVKSTERPTPSDARHILDFLAEKGPRARDGFVICRTPRAVKLHERVTALPWSSL